MSRTMPRGLVALSSSAIAAIYFTGYVITRGADAQLGSSEELATPSLIAPATAQPTASVIRRAPIVVPTLVPTTAPANQSAVSPTQYHDGTFQGSGTSRRGGVVVAVTIQDGRVSNVAFTQVTTQYPVSRIAALPGQTVARQSAQIDRVTGATYSTQAYQQAVQQALSRAQAGAPLAAAASDAPA